MPSCLFNSALTADAEKVWAHASTLAGVNEELWPLHMSGGDSLRLDASVKLGEPLLRSVLSLWRVVPLDLHSLALAEVWPRRGFREASHSLLQRRWIHVRTIEPLAANACVLRDSVEFEPRVLPWLMAQAVDRVFRRRHAYLRRKFGASTAPAEAWG